MSVIVRLQNLPWAANAVDIRQYFHGLSIPEGGVHIVGGEMGDAFIAFSTDEDARQAMLRDGGKVKEVKIKLFLSSRAEMQKIIDQARQQSLGMQQFMTMPTMQQLPVPATPIAVPNMSVPSVTIPSNMQNVPAMQVPLQNVQDVQNVAAMVSHMVPKPEESGIGAPPVPPSGLLPAQSDPQITSASSSVKGDSEKDKKDKRRRRTRSHSRDRSDSRSRSRSGSRSRSRSKDRKGRDRYYDRERRRRRSRSRDRRRRRERTRSRERTSREKRRDHRHGSRDDGDDNSQQNAASSRWGAPPQRNQQLKSSRPDFFNRHQQPQSQQQNRNVPPFGPRGAPNMNNNGIRPEFPNVNLDQNRLHGPNVNTGNTRPSIPATKNVDITKPNNNTGNIPSASTTNSSIPDNTNATLQPGNVFGNFQPGTGFNPQQMVSYPTFSPSGMGSFNSGYSMSGSQQQMQGNMVPGNFNKQESFDGKKMNHIKDVKPNASSIKQQSNDTQVKFNNQDSKPEESDDLKTNNIPLPNLGNASMQTNNSVFGWGGFDGNNYSFGGMNPYSNFPKDEGMAHSNFNPQQFPHQQFFPPKWEAPQEKVPFKTGETNPNPEKSPNNCVQIKNVPVGTTAEDIRTFFRNSMIPTGWLKIISSDSNDNEVVVYVRFTSMRDKKQAILRSGCLLNNSIVTVLHVDDFVYDNAVDVKSNNNAGSELWNSREQKNESGKKQTEIEVAGKIRTDKEQKHDESHNCIKIAGSLRYHPFFTHNHKMYPHIRTVCDKFKPVDVCIMKTSGHNLSGYMKFESSSILPGVLKHLSNAKIEGRPVTISTCSEDEFDDGRNNCMPLDTQKFLKNASNPSNKRNNYNSMQEKTPKVESGFLDPRMKQDNSAAQDDFNDDVEMKITNKPTPALEPPRNKVLLPTPPAGMQPPYEANPMLQTNCIVIHNLPLQANDHDILDFFSDIGVIPTQIHIMLDTNGKPSGDAFCEFERSEEAMNAASKNDCPMGRNTIYVRLVSGQEMATALGVAFKTPAPQAPPYFTGPPMMGNIRVDQSQDDWSPSYPSGSSGPLGPPGSSDSPYNNDYDYDYEDDDIYDGPGSRGGGRGGRGRGFSDRGFRSRERGGRGIRGSSFRGGGSGFMGDGSSRGGPSSIRGGGFRGRGGRGGLERGGRGSFERGGRGGFERGGRGGMERGGRGSSERGGRGGMDRGGRGHGRGSSREMSEGFDDFENSRNHPVPLMSLAPGGGPPIGQTPSQIQLEADSVREFGRPGCVVSAENIPYRADITDILEFFGDFDLTPECVIRRYNDEGKITGDARIAFKSSSDARRAIKYLDHKTLGNRKVTLSLFK